MDFHQPPSTGGFDNFPYPYGTPKFRFIFRTNFNWCITEKNFRHFFSVKHGSVKINKISIYARIEKKKYKQKQIQKQNKTKKKRKTNKTPSHSRQTSNKTKVDQRKYLKIHLCVSTEHTAEDNSRRR